MRAFCDLCFFRTLDQEFGLFIFGLNGTHLYLFKPKTKMSAFVLKFMTLAFMQQKMNTIFAMLPHLKRTHKKTVLCEELYSSQSCFTLNNAEADLVDVARPREYVCFFFSKQWFRLSSNVRVSKFSSKQSVQPCAIPFTPHTTVKNIAQFVPLDQLTTSLYRLPLIRKARRFLIITHRQKTPCFFSIKEERNPAYNLQNHEVMW